MDRTLHGIPLNGHNEYYDGSGIEQSQGWRYARLSFVDPKEIQDNSSTLSPLPEENQPYFPRLVTIPSPL